MLFAFDLLGVFVAALSGALLAARKEMDVFGFFVLGIVTGIGGGTLRDVILDLPVFWVQNQLYLVATLFAGFLAFTFARQAMNGWRKKAILWFDAMAMSFFAATGAIKAQSADAGLLVVILMAFITATAGGLIRDMMAQETPFIFRGEIYATAAIFGGILVVVLNAFELERPLIISFAVMGAFSIRALAIFFGWRLQVKSRAD